MFIQHPRAFNENSLILDEMAYTIGLTGTSEEFRDYLNEDMVKDFKRTIGTTIVTHAKTNEETQKIRKELEDINDDLQNDRVDLRDLKSDWNRLISVASLLIGSIVTVGMVMGFSGVSYDPTSTASRVKAGMLSQAKGIGIGLLIGLIVRVANGIILRAGEKKDLQIIKKDILDVKRKLEEKKAKDKGKAAAYDNNIRRLDALLEKVEKTMRDKEYED